MNLDHERKELERIKKYLDRAMARGDEKRREKIEKRFIAKQLEIAELEKYQKDIRARENTCEDRPSDAGVLLAAISMFGGAGVKFLKALR